MNARHIARLLSATGVAAGAILCSTTAPQAAAAACPDAEIVFARGTSEPAGVGGTGQGFVDAVRAQLGSRSVDVYPVNYAASGDFFNREAFVGSFMDGVRDAGAHVQATAANCPNTKIVLGGYSQGAAVAEYVTTDQRGPGVPASVVIPKPLPPNVASHVAAVTLFGNPSQAFLQQFESPQFTIGSQYVARTIDLCAPGDNICDGSPGLLPSAAHTSYGFNGMTDQAATFARQHVEPAA